MYVTIRKTLFILYAVALAIFYSKIACANTLVFLDNSGSIKTELSENYQENLLAIMSVISGPTWFAPVGDCDVERNIFPIIKSSKSKKMETIKKVFAFNDNYTKIDGSLKMAEDYLREKNIFDEIDKILVISDMEPDYQVNRKPFYFEEKEYDDLINYLTRLESWLTEKEDRKIVFYLHDWNQKPESYNSNKDSLFDDIRYSRNHVTKCKKNHWDIPENCSTNRQLVKDGLARLKDKYGNRVRLEVIPIKVPASGISGGTIPNTEGLIDCLCNNLEVKDKKQEVCIVSTKKDFKVKVAFSTRLLANEGVGPKIFKKHIPDEIEAGHLRRIEAKVYYTLSGLSLENVLDDADYFARIDRGNTHNPFAKPKITLYSKADQRQGGSITPAMKNVCPPEELTSVGSMMKWTAGKLEDLLKADIKENYPPSMKFKEVIIQDFIGHDLAQGFDFRAAPVDSSLGDIKMFRPTKKKGKVKLKVYTEGDSKIVYGWSLDDDFFEGEIKGLKLTNAQIRSRGVEKIRLPKKAFVKVPFSFDVSELKGLVTNDVYLKIIKKASNLNELYTAKKHVFSDIPHEYLLPGEYLIEVYPQDDGILSFFLNSYLVKKFDQSVDKQGLLLELDPLANRNIWNEKFSRFIAMSSLHGEAVKLAPTSSNFLMALLTFSSEKFAKNENIYEVRRLWKGLKDEVYFNPETSQTMLRRSQRSMRNIGLIEKEFSPGTFKDSENTQIVNDDILKGEMFLEMMFGSMSGDGCTMNPDYTAWIEILVETNSFSPELKAALLNPEPIRASQETFSDKTALMDESLMQNCESSDAVL
ncbi:hypothetical protein [Desulfatibacillum aliphaticivorans]|uniref:hypothetical protein n=1 Tax=Desulfatibacillum aliphaticivorans TaxID=218208 RepID=UPI000483F49F|nr:hypothetical protein [Desulfatibacillum aliphaticivorans]